MTTPSRTDDSDTTRADPADVFALLGDDTRLAIISALHDTKSLTFSDLFDRVDLDDSGQFNYHLSKLLDRFVTKQDGTYRLTAAGRRTARAVEAGLYTDSPELDPFAVDGTCTDCGEPALEASYSGERFQLTCSACGNRLLRVNAPPSLVRGRTPHEALAAFEDWSHRQVAQAAADLCPTCGGSVDRGVTEQTPESLPFDVLPVFNCSVCGRRVYTSFGAIATEDPTAAAFLERADLTVDDHHYWELDHYISDEGLDLLSESPFRMAVTITAPDEACRVVIDDDLRVRETEIITSTGDD